MHALLERVSLIFQHDGFSIGDIGAEADTSIDEDCEAHHSMRQMESQVYTFTASGRGYWAENSFAITCDANDKDVEAHKSDRLYLCRHLAGASDGILCAE